MASSTVQPRDPLSAAVECLEQATLAMDTYFLNRLRDKSTPNSGLIGSASTAKGSAKGSASSSKDLLSSVRDFASSTKSALLLEYKPTLAHLARFHKLQRLRDLLEKFADIYRDLRARRGDLGSEKVRSQADSFAAQSQSLCSQIRDMWATKKAALDATYCLQYVKALEFKINELHKHCLKLLDCCFDLLKAAKSEGTTRLPINQEIVLEIADSMPAQYTIEAD